jgi:hypothetical protein
MFSFVSPVSLFFYVQVKKSKYYIHFLLIQRVFHSTKKIQIYIFLLFFSAAEVQAPDETKIPRVAIVAIGKRVPQDWHSSF